MKDFERYALLGARLAAIAIAILLALVFGVVANAEPPPPVLTVSVVVDPVTRDKLGEDATRAWIAFTMKTAAEVYRAQLGLDVRTTRVEFNHVADDTQPIFLLAQLAKLRTADTLLYETGVTLFFTDRTLRIGRQFFEGYAYYGPVCSSFAVAIVSFEADSYTTAHELGHVLNAPHDGEGVCAKTPKTGYLMQSEGDGATQFSQCSLDVIRETIKDAPCLYSSPACRPAECSPPPVKKSGAGSLDEILLGFMLGFLFMDWLRRRR